MVNVEIISTGSICGDEVEAIYNSQLIPRSKTGSIDFKEQDCLKESDLAQNLRKRHQGKSLISLARSS
jgi:hypothetical protein